MKAVKKITHPWGSLSFLTSSLIWAKYGYWQEKHAPPSWYDGELKLAEQVANIVQPANTQYEVIFDAIIPGEVMGKFRVWDAANPWVEPWEVRFQSISKESAEREYLKEYLKHKELHEGVINALLHYKETGEPVEPSWLPSGNTNFHWLKKDYRPNNYMGFRKLQRLS